MNVCPRVRVKVQLVLGSHVACHQRIVRIILAREFRRNLHDGIGAHVDLWTTFLTTLGGNKDHTVGTIDGSCRGVLQYRDVLYRTHIDRRKGTFDTIHEDEWCRVVPG